MDHCSWRADNDFPEEVIGEGLKFLYILLNEGREYTHAN